MGERKSKASFVVNMTNSNNSFAMKPYWTCSGAVLSQGSASISWTLNETSGNTIIDSTANHYNGTYKEAISPVKDGVCVKDNAYSQFFDGSGSGGISNRSYPMVGTFSEEVWFKTTDNKGGRLIGFSGNTTYAAEIIYDRILFINSNSNPKIRTNYQGYLKVGHGARAGFKLSTGASITDAYRGYLQYATYYTSELSADEVAAHYNFNK